MGGRERNPNPAFQAFVTGIAFLISPYGLPMAAIWLLGKVQDLSLIHI